MVRPLRVALVTEFYYPHLGGVTEHVHNLALELEAMGHEPVVITSRMSMNGHADAAFVRRVGRSVVIYKNGSFARISVGLDLQRDIERVLREERIDLLHVHGGLALTFGLVAPEAARRAGIPAVATFHSWFREALAYRIFRKPLQARLDRLHARIAVSEPVVDKLSEYFRGDFDVIPNGIDPKLFRPVERSGCNAPGDGPRLLFLGRLDPRNGLGTALRALPLILERHPAARLAIAGTGPLTPYYRALASPVKDNVDFLGPVFRERPGLYRNADLYLCPTRKASFGITLLEAMASGTPMIVSDIHGFRELIDGGDEAVLAPVDNPRTWAEAVCGLLDDPERRARMAAAGIAKARRFAWPRVAAEILDVYRRVLSPSVPRIAAPVPAEPERELVSAAALR